jgi:uncharacterized protein YkvS
LLPPLGDSTFASLEKNIIKYGCKFPLVLWDKILIDGYNNRLRSLARVGDVLELKSALRSCIEELEDFYRQI